MQISKRTGSRRCYFGEEKLKMDRIASDVTAVALRWGYISIGGYGSRACDLCELDSSLEA